MHQVRAYKPYRWPYISKMVQTISYFVCLSVLIIRIPVAAYDIATLTGSIVLEISY